MTYNFSLNFMNIIIVVFLMIDAPKYGKNQILWGVLGFFFGPFALAVYLYQTGRTGWAIVWLVIGLLGVAAIASAIFIGLHMFLHAMPRFGTM